MEPGENIRPYIRPYIPYNQPQYSKNVQFQLAKLSKNNMAKKYNHLLWKIQKSGKKAQIWYINGSQIRNNMGITIISSN